VQRVPRVILTFILDLITTHAVDSKTVLYDHHLTIMNDISYSPQCNTTRSVICFGITCVCAKMMSTVSPALEQWDCTRTLTSVFSLPFGPPRFHIQFFMCTAMRFSPISLCIHCDIYGVISFGPTGMYMYCDTYVFIRFGQLRLCTYNDMSILISF